MVAVINDVGTRALYAYEALQRWGASINKGGSWVHVGSSLH